MFAAFLAKAAVPLLIVSMAIGLVGGIGLQQRVFDRNESVDYDKVRRIIVEELAKLPKPKPQQGLEIDKIKGKVGKLEIHQDYDVQVNGDSLVMERFGSVVEEKLKSLKVSRCK